MSRPLKTFLRNAFSFLLAFAFLYFAFRDARVADLWYSLRTANYWWILLLVPVNVLSHWIRAVRWRYLLKPVKTGLSDRNLFSGVMIGYAVNNVLPRVGELVRPYVLGRLEPVSKSAALGTVVIERILDFTSFYFIVCVMIAIYPHSLDPFLPNTAAVGPLFLVASLAALVVFLLLFFKAEAMVRFLGRWKHHIPARYRGTADHILESFTTGLNVSRLREHSVAIILLSLAMWAVYALGMYVPFFSLDALAARGLHPGDAVLLLVISSIAWVLPAPGAMGTYHSFVTIVLVRLYGIDMTTALSYSIITHEVGYIVVMALGAGFYLRDREKIGNFTTMSGKGETLST